MPSARGVRVRHERDGIGRLTGHMTYDAVLPPSILRDDPGQGQPVSWGHVGLRTCNGHKLILCSMAASELYKPLECSFGGVAPVTRWVYSINGTLYLLHFSMLFV